MSWTTYDPRKPLDVLSVYEDWENAVRPGFQKKKGSENWQPVYVRLEPPLAVNARTLLHMIDAGAASPPAITAGDEARRALADLAAPSTGPLPEHRAWLFVYRPESEAYAAVTDSSGTPLYTVLRVGPAVPFAFLPKPASVPPPSGFGPRSTPLLNVVATGIIDDAIGVMHERFRDGKGKTRVARWWKMGVEAISGNAHFPPALRALQGAHGGRPAPLRVSNGVAGEGHDLDLLFEHCFQRDEGAMYRAIEKGVDPAGVTLMPALRRTMTQRASHGTWVTDLAAGFPPDKAPAGRPIFAVELPALATAETSGARLEMYVLQALLQLIDWADTWPDPVDAGKTVAIPLVINLSYGFSAGPKDGEGFLEREILRHVAARNAQVPTAIVIAAGNDFRSSLRAQMKLPKDGHGTIDLRVQPQDRTPGFLEIRLPRKFRGSLTVTPPSPHGANPGTLMFDGNNPAAGMQSLEWNVGSAVIARLYVQPEGVKRILVTLALRATQNPDDPGQAAPAGAWEVAVRNKGKATAVVTFDVQRDDAPRGFPRLGRQAYLETPDYGAKDGETQTYTTYPEDAAVTRKGTLSAIATAEDPCLFVAGGAIDARRGGPDDSEPARYASSGPNGSRPGPDLGAISEDGYATPGLRAAGTFSGSSVVFGGTSAATPVVARAVADFVAANRRLPVVDEILDGNGPSAFPARLGTGMVERPGQMRLPRRRAG